MRRMILIFALLSLTNAGIACSSGSEISDPESSALSTELEFSLIVPDPPASNPDINYGNSTNMSNERLARRSTFPDEDLKRFENWGRIAGASHTCSEIGFAGVITVQVNISAYKSIRGAAQSISEQAVPKSIADWNRSFSGMLVNLEMRSAPIVGDESLALYLDLSSDMSTGVGVLYTFRILNYIVDIEWLNVGLNDILTADVVAFANSIHRQLIEAQPGV